MVSNRLGEATSPYLRQHAHQPVHWWPWSAEAFERARLRGVPVFLSIGYSACHWCHVMAHESFDDPVVAAALNDGFVAIKVDREERPDVDAVYMDATQATTGSGGWPMTVFLTADGEPFHCGTYYPRSQLLGLLAAVRQAWVGRRAEVLGSAAHLANALRSSYAAPAVPAAVDPAALERAATSALSDLDPVRGGFGSAPKFPPAMVLEALLRHTRRTGSVAAAAAVDLTCTAMARGGLYDQLDGGFARYAVDAAWRVPHFEKMLYDNALLARVYLHWWQVGADPLGLRVVRETLDFLLARMLTPEGCFAAALDADTEGTEGATYLWTPGQLEDVLGVPGGARAAQLLGVGTGAAVDGAWTLTLAEDPQDLDDAQWWAQARARLAKARAARPQPERDDKVVTAWNGLAIAAFAEAGLVLGEPRYVAAATRAADFLLAHHLSDAGLRRSSLGGIVGPAWGVGEDYGDLAEGLLTLHQATGDGRWLAAAGGLLDHALAAFSAPDGGFFDTAGGGDLFARPRSVTDNAEPCGQSSLATALVGYGLLAGSTTHLDAGSAALAAGAGLLARAPRFAGWAWALAEALATGPVQVVISDCGPDAEALWEVAASTYLGGGYLVRGAADAPGVPLLSGRPGVSGASAAYRCRGTVCDLPVTSSAELAAALRG